MPVNCGGLINRCPVLLMKRHTLSRCARFYRTEQMQEKNRRKQPGRNSFFWEIPGDVPGYRIQPDPYQGVRETRNSGYDAPTRTGGHSDASVSGNSFRWLFLLILFLLLSGISVVGYHHYFINSDLDTASTKQPKVFELTLGQKNKTAHSKVRTITHVVVKGDTLWDIAKKYVKDPFRYPELARLSKIKNPDLIYPYDLVRIRIYEQPIK